MSCTDCPLYKKEREIPYRGNPDADIVFIYESAGSTEVKEGVMLIGPSLKYVTKECERVGLDFNSVFLMNAARCRINKDKYTAGEIGKILKACRPNVETALKTIQPKLIVCFGAIALQQVYHKMAIKRARNRIFWSDEFNAHIMVTFHPAAIMRDPNKLPLYQADFDAMIRFIKNNYQSKSDVIYKEVESIQPILDGNCYKEGSYSLIGIDTETQGVDWHNKNSVIISYQVSKDLDEGWTVILQEECEKDKGDYNITVQRGGSKKTPEYIEVGIKKTEGYDRKVNELKELLQRQDIKKYFFNQKFEQHRFMNLGIIDWNNCCMDVRTAAHCLDSTMYRDCSLEDVISQFAPTNENHKGIVTETEKADMLMLLQTDRDKFIKYASLDPVFTLRTALEVRKKLLADKKSLNYFINFAQPIENEFLFDMERNGVLVDKDKIPEIRTALQKEMDRFKQQFIKLTPPLVYHKYENNFQLTRTVILQESLFTWKDKKLKKADSELKLHDIGFNLKPIVMNKKSGTPSVDKKVLATIIDGKYPKTAKELIRTHIKWNERRMLINNFLKNIAHYLDEGNRLHTNFSITFTSSGRVASRNPGLMNQPKHGDLAKYIRSLFIAEDNFKVCHCDYNASELRWVAHVAQEKELMRIFAEGKDPHRITGLWVRDLPEDYKFESEKELKMTRQNSKPLSFGLIYLMSWQGLKKYAKQGYGVEYTDKQAKDNVSKFFQKYNKIPIWHTKDRAFLAVHGYLRTDFGRKLVLPNIFSEEDAVRAMAERTGINGKIQSPSSDGTLLAGYEILKDKRVDKRHFKTILFIHDALVFAIAADKIDYYLPIIKEHMENIPTERFDFKMTVPLKIEAEIGDRMSDLQEYQF